MLSADRLSPIGSRKSKSSSRHNLLDDGEPNKTPFDIIEHDVTTLAQVGHLPPADSFDALQIGSER